MNGIDISNNDGIGFIVAKATQGTTFVDAYYKQNIANAKSVGLLAGAYHFAEFTDISTAIKDNNCQAKIIK